MPALDENKRLYLRLAEEVLTNKNLALADELIAPDFREHVGGEVRRVGVEVSRRPAHGATRPFPIGKSPSMISLPKATRSWLAPPDRGRISANTWVFRQPAGASKSAGSRFTGSQTENWPSTGNKSTNSACASNSAPS